MPEAPDLEVVKEFLTKRAVGLRVKACTAPRATVVRDLAGVLTATCRGAPWMECTAREVPLPAILGAALLGDQPDAHRRPPVLSGERTPAKVDLRVSFL